MSISRRGFVLGTSALALLLTLPMGCGRQESTGEIAGDATADTSDADRSLDAIALAVMGFDASQLTDERGADALRDELEAGIRAAQVDDESVEAALRRLVAQDHARGDVVEVDGWQLARHEYMLLALAAAVSADAGRSTLVEAASADDAERTDFAVVKAWGPKATCAGQSFNAQSDGHSSLWVSLEDGPISGLKVMIGGVVVPTTQVGHLVTTRLEGDLFNELFGEADELEVELYDDHENRRQVLGQFSVAEDDAFATTEEGAVSTVFREVETWGPQATTVLAPFNPQPDGSSAFWIRTRCAPQGTQIWLGDTRLEASLSMEILTARLLGLEALRETGELPLRLVDPTSGESVEVGRFRVAP